MRTSWPDPVERVAGFLRTAGAEARLEEFRGGTSTAADAARAVGCRLERVVKSVVVMCDGRPVVVLVPGDRRADTAKIAAAAGAARARVATAVEAEAASGYGPGGVAPFALPPDSRVFVDHGLLGDELVWVGGGAPTHLVALRPAELVRLARAQPVDAVVAPTYHSAAKGGSAHA